MKIWEEFEISCTKYLNERYGEFAKFIRNGGCDSTVPDIKVVTNKNEFYIESKMSQAQSGQFVLLPDEKNRKFIFSPRNRSNPNEMTETITHYMNMNFNRYNKAGTTGEILDIDNEVFGNWIVEFYKSKNVKYFITYRDSYIVFPTNKFNNYFTISAKYRVKKSGSTEPAKKDFANVMNILLNEYNIESCNAVGKKLFVNGDIHISKIHFVFGKHTYYLSPKEENLFEVRRLSNTYNMNVIFSIKLKSKQNKEDLSAFENEIK